MTAATGAREQTLQVLKITECRRLRQTRQVTRGALTASASRVWADKRAFAR